jgi:hypothetical protein
MMRAHYLEGRMRRLAVCLIALLLASPGSTPRAQPAPAPHAWLYGAWTGGLFPVPANMTAQICLSQPVVIFTRDLVLRATLIDTLYQQRVIETVRSNPAGSEFRFTPSVDPNANPTASLLGRVGRPPLAGFGCETADVLHVLRRGENEIVFQGCTDFPEPLIRCPAK